jgi:hypothetical protein
MPNRRQELVVAVKPSRLYRNHEEEGEGVPFREEQDHRKVSERSGGENDLREPGNGVDALQ